MGFRTYLWDRRRSWLLALGLLAVLLMVLLLFRLPVLAVGYGALLCGVIYLGAGIWDFVQWSRRHHRRKNRRNCRPWSRRAERAWCRRSR